MIMSRSLSLAAVVVLCLGSAVTGQIARPLAAPPADIRSGLVRLPDPAALLSRSSAATIPVAFDEDGVFAVELPVSRPGALTLVPLAPGVTDWSLTLQAPGSEPRGLQDWVTAGRASFSEESLPELAEGAWAPRWIVDTQSTGRWSLTIRRLANRATGEIEGLLFVTNDTPGTLVSHRTTHQLHNGHGIGLLAWLEVPQVETGTFWIEAATPLGSLTIPMHDDGRSGDGVAGDGVWGGVLPPLPPGPVVARVHAVTEGAWRTVTHAFEVVERAAMLSGEARAVVIDDASMSVDIGAWLFGEPAKLHVSAEVWGRDDLGTLQPVAWLSTMLVPDASGQGPLSLHLDARWLAEAGVTSDLELRHVRIQDPDTHAVHDFLRRVPMDVAGLPAAALTAPVGVTPAMLTGPPGGAGSADLAGEATTGRTLGVPQGQPPEPKVRSLLLVHGYCSGGNVWPDSDFSGNTIQFFDPDENRSHDEFAQLIVAQAVGTDSFGVVGHSQGGTAALHLLTYYSSGLDLALGNRRIQAVATPWAGTPLAGALADIGAIFGLGCGANDDLTDAGAALWLSGIPSWARAEVSYWTTEDEGCSGISFLLDDPDDGVVEMAAGQLSGANNMGHVTGWCHSTGMSAPANYTDPARNAEMDAEAAR